MKIQHEKVLKIHINKITISRLFKKQVYNYYYINYIKHKLTSAHNLQNDQNTCLRTRNRTINKQGIDGLDQLCFHSILRLQMGLIRTASEPRNRPETWKKPNILISSECCYL